MSTLIKKFGWLSGLLFALLVLSGCGGGGGGNDLPDQPDRPYSIPQPASIDLNETTRTFQMEIPFEKSDTDVKVTLSNFSFRISGCSIVRHSLKFTPLTLVMAPGIDSGILKVSGRFSSKCTPNDYVISYREKSEMGGKTKTANYTRGAKITNGGGGGGSPAGSFVMYVTPSEIKVLDPDTPKTIKVQLAEYDSTGEHLIPAADQNVSVNVFDARYGSFDNWKGVTDANGEVKFTYTSPHDITSIWGQKYSFDIYVPEQPKVSQNVTLTFGDGAIYTIVPDKNLTISKVNTHYQINVALYRDVGQGAEPATGRTVVAEFLMPMYGKLSKYEAVVSEDGLATFDYISPDKISDLNDTNLTFYYKENREVRGNTALVFQPESVEKVERLYIVPGSITITQGGEERNITIITVNSKNMGISTEVSIEQPSTDEGDYGYFDPSGPIMTDNSGRANVVYHAPNSITGLSERNITFTAKVDEHNNLSNQLNIIYTEGTGPGIDYEISVMTRNTLEVGSSMGRLTVTIHKRGDLNSPIPNDDVLDVNVTTLFPQMIDFDGKNVFHYDGEGVKAIPVQTHTLAGTAVVRVDALIYNGDKNVMIHEEYPIVIMSGPVTAMSIFYVYSEQDQDTGVFRNHYTIHAVDKYNNPARPGVALHPSAINGTKVVRTRGSTATGTLKADDPARFEDPTANYDDVVTGSDGDILIVIPNAKRFDRLYTGTWSIDDVENSTTLQLSDSFGPSDVDKLSYLVGGSKRYLSEYGVATADIESETGNYLTDENGNVKFIVNFDPVLAGHTLTLGAVAHDRGERTGVSKIEMFRWLNYTSSTVKVPNNGKDTNVILSLGIANIEGNPLEHLINVEIPYDAITSTSAQCQVVVNNPDNNMTTNSNGRIHFIVHTLGTDPNVNECLISWIKRDSGIYLEY